MTDALKQPSTTPEQPESQQETLASDNPEAQAPTQQPGSQDASEEGMVMPRQANETNAKPSTADAVNAPTLADLQAHLAETQSKAKEYLEGWQRARAEFDNFRKRADRERDTLFQDATVQTLIRILPVLDDFERAIATVPAERVDDEVIKGFSLISRKLATLLENAGVKAIDPQGQPFDPLYHEALGQEPAANVPEGHVSSVLQKGYRYGDRVLRPALVRVAG